MGLVATHLLPLMQSDDVRQLKPYRHIGRVKISRLRICELIFPGADVGLLPIVGFNVGLNDGFMEGLYVAA